MITKMLQKIQENYGTILGKYYLCQYGTQEIENVRKMYVLGTMLFDVVFRCFYFVGENVITYFENVFVGMRIEK